MMQGKKFISPGAWFSLVYPSAWNEFEDGEGSFLFYNPDTWTGNFRISAYKEEFPTKDNSPAKSGSSAKGNTVAQGDMTYARRTVQLELKDNPSSSLVKVGHLECAYSKEMFQEDGAYYTTHVWITGIDNIAFECSFTVPKGGEVKEAENIIASLEIRHDGQKYPEELIPVRLSEISYINEAYDWVVNIVKKEQKTDFQGIEEDLPKLQQLVDSGLIGPRKKEEWMAVGITICTILANEVEGLEWMTFIDGNREVPVLQYKDGRIIDPMKLAWSKVKAGENCNVEAAYQLLITHE